MKKKSKKFRNADIEKCLSKMRDAGHIDLFAFYADGKCWEVDCLDWKVSPLYVELKDVNSLSEGTIEERVLSAMYFEIDRHREICDKQVDILAMSLNLL